MRTALPICFKRFSVLVTDALFHQLPQFTKSLVDVQQAPFRKAPLERLRYCRQSGPLFSGWSPALLNLSQDLEGIE